MDNLHKTPLVTIAIPFYNAEKFMRLAIDSVIHQTCKDWKLLLIDDGSTDNSLTIAKDYEKVDTRIKVYSDGENKNLGYRLNQIPNLTNTKYLARMDADDIMHPERIQKQIDILEKHPEIDVLGTNAYSIDEDGNKIGIRLNPEGKEPLSKVSSFIHPTIMAKTDWFRNNPYDPNAERIEDVELWIRTSKKYNFMVINEPLFYYREIGSKYYIKYFKGIPSLKYLIKKDFSNLSYHAFAVRYFTASIRSYIYHIIGKEKEMIKKRNQIIL